MKAISLQLPGSSLLVPVFTRTTCACEGPICKRDSSFLIGAGDNCVKKLRLSEISLLFWPVCPFLGLPVFSTQPPDEGL